jgi:hypothetical protein
VQSKRDQHDDDTHQGREWDGPRSLAHPQLFFYRAALRDRIRRSDSRASSMPSA